MDPLIIWVSIAGFIAGGVLGAYLGFSSGFQYGKNSGYEEATSEYEKSLNHNTKGKN